MLKSRFSPAKVLGELRSEVDKLVIDLGREADRDVAILESRIKNLRALIDEADRRILVADREFAKKERESAVIADVRVPERPKANPVSESRANQVTPSVAVSAPSDAKPQRPAEQPVTIYTRPAVKRSEAQIEPLIPTRERVLEMARKGITAPMIANTLSLSLGEVELILDMNRSSL
jgi:DNA-binding NarL/FixJ family response regulator